MNILELLEYEEGYRKDAYYCSEGYPTIGIGQKIGPKGAPLKYYNFTVSRDVSYAWLGETVETIKGQLSTSIETQLAYHNCTPARKVIMESMCYQLGFDGLTGFRMMIKAMERMDWTEAANQALDSLWAKQTPERANRHADVIRMGTFKGAY